MKTKLDPSKLSIAFTNRDLCTRSGTCVGICPEGALSVGEDMYPVIDESKCTECGLCAKVCPGGHVYYKELSELTFGDNEDVSSFDGRVLNTYIGHAAKLAFRNGGAGGGVVTSLLYDMLEHGDVDGVLATRMKPDTPWLGEPFIARTFEEVRQTQGSRYSIIPMNAIFQQVLKEEGRFALAALPCQVHGFRKAVAESPELREKIYCVLGLFCGGGLEPFFVPELLRTKGVRQEEIENFEFRGGAWPGKMRAILKNGRVRHMHYSNYKDGAYNYFTGIYMPFRCQTCLDGSCEFSDISTGDAWTRDEDGEYKFPGHSRIMVRTPRGQEVLQRAVERGSLVVNDVTKDPSYVTHALHTKRKRMLAPLRIARLKKQGVPVPEYDREAPEATFKERLNERIIGYLLSACKHFYIRYPLVKFLTSIWATPLIFLRMQLKKRKYANRKKESKNRAA